MIRAGSLFRSHPEKVMPLLEVRREYIEAAFAEMEKEYGSVDAYMQKGLGVDTELKKQLKARFLQSH